MGTVVESPAEYYSSRIPNKGRKTTLVDELLNDSEFRRYVRSTFRDVERIVF
jgi:Fcf2 pre-rRNA processing